MHTHTHRLIAPLVIVALAACSRTPDATCPVDRLDLLMQAYPTLTATEQIDTIEALRPELSAMFAVTGYGEVDTYAMDQWATSDAVRVFQPAVDSVYSDTRTLESMVGYMLRRAEADSLGLPHLSFATVTWGNRRPLVRADSVVLIALNHYLGADYPGYQGWPEYRRRDKTPEQLPYDLAGALAATQHPMDLSAQATLLSRMLYEGALVEARMRMVRDPQLHLAVGMSAEQLELAEKNTRQIWDEMAVRRLIYDTDPVVADRYIDPAPSTPLLSGNAPGRIGRYIGYRIVRAYLDRHKDTTLDYLLSSAFYASPQTLIDSGFTPR